MASRGAFVRARFLLGLLLSLPLGAADLSGKFAQINSLIAAELSKHPVGSVTVCDSVSVVVVPQPQDLSLWLRVNGHRYQHGTTKTMIFDIAYLVSHISRYMTLLPGDIISTGTPPGVGMGQKPQVFLQPGDVVELGIDGLGTQRQHVVASP